MKLDNDNHSVFLMYYHLILVIKYRRKVIDEDISKRLKEIFEYIAPNYNITVLEWNDDIDHIHILFKGNPATISQTSSGKYYVSILFEYEQEINKKELNKFVGLDF